jgi:hypothetical protein
VVVPFLPVCEEHFTDITDTGVSHLVTMVSTVVQIYLAPTVELTVALFTFHLPFAVEILYNVLVGVKFEIVFYFLKFVQFIEKSCDKVS